MVFFVFQWHKLFFKIWIEDVKFYRSVLFITQRHTSFRQTFVPDVAPSFLYELFDESLPDKPVSLEEIQKLLEEKLIPYNTHFSHPAIWD